MISVADAQTQILNVASPLPAETVFVGDVQGRVLAADCHALRSLPPWDNSAMDGFALLAADSKGATQASPVKLALAGDRFAGDAPRSAVKGKKGQALRIMTGAPIPPGCDAVIIRENTSAAGGWVEGLKEVELHSAVEPGANIRRAGEDVTQDTLVGKKGDPLSPARINLLAAAGHVAIQVHRRPTVAILASGDELREVGTPLSPEAIVNSNAHAIAAAIKSVGGLVHLAGIARDTLEDHRAHIAASTAFDILVTIGGVSAGARDHVRPALDAEGMETLFYKVAQKPGKPLLFGKRGQQLVMGLPGNPVSALVGFHLYLAPMLRRMQGLRSVRPARLSARLKADAPEDKRKDLTYFARGKLIHEKGEHVFVPGRKQGSGQISGMAEANALAVYPAGVETVPAGTTVDVILLDNRALLSE
jgi:molybdopterin molybdotransferase